jgi:hypothetical protein
MSSLQQRIYESMLTNEAISLQEIRDYCTNSFCPIIRNRNAEEMKAEDEKHKHKQKNNIGLGFYKKLLNIENE